jgi:hypothetical protein
MRAEQRALSRGRLSQHATPIQDGVEDFDLVFLRSFFLSKKRSVKEYILEANVGLNEF